MSDLRKALLAGISFEIIPARLEGPYIVARHGERQLFIQHGTKELNDFEQLEVAATAAIRVWADLQKKARGKER